MLVDTLTLINGADIVNMTVASGTSDPSSATVGGLFFRTDLNVIRVYTGSAWVTVGSNSSTATSLAGGAAGSIPYQTAASTTSFIAAGTNGYVLTMVSGVPTWAAASGGITSVSGTANQITATTVSNATTLSLPSSIIFNGANQTFAFPSTSSTGYSLTITSGASSGGNGGALTMYGGAPGAASAVGGAVNIFGGGPTASTGYAGMTGGAVNIIGGGDIPALASGQYASGGVVTIAGGQGSTYNGSASGGNLILQGGTVQYYQTSGAFTLTPGYISFQTAGVVSTTGSATGTTALVERLRIEASGDWLVNSTAGTSGQVLTSQGSGLTPVWATPSSSPSLTAKYIGYGSSGGVLTGTSDFTWTESAANPILTLGPLAAASAGTTTIQANTSNNAGFGQALSITGSTNSAGNGGAVNITGGSSAGTWTSGTVNITGGSGTNPSVGGNVVITGGTGVGTSAGSVTIAGGGISSGGIAGGSVTISAGASGNASTGANVLIQAGTVSTTGTGGNVVFQTGNTSLATVLTINSSGALGFGSSPSYGTSGQVLTSNGSTGVPTWSTAGASSGISGGAAGEVLYQTGSSTTGFTGVGTAGQVLQSNGSSAPTWVSTLSSTVTGSSLTSVGTLGSLTVSGATNLNSTLNVSGTITQTGTVLNLGNGSTNTQTIQVVASTSTSGGNGAALSIAAATGGTQATTGIGGNGGALNLNGGAGGNVPGTSDGGVGGAVNITGGQGGYGNSSFQYINAGGAVNITGGIGNPGGTITLIAGGSGTTSQNAGSIIFKTGAGAFAANTSNNSSISMYTGTSASTLAFTINATGAFGLGTTPSYGTSGQVLTSQGSGSAPTWTTPSTTASTATNIAGGAAGELVYQTGSGATGFTAVGTSGQVLVSGGTGSPTWTSTPTLTGTNFTGIPTSALTNSSITVGTTPISLGSSSTSLAGLTQLTLTNANSNITGVGTPVNSSDAANKAYVDSVAAGLSWKQPAIYATTTNLSGTYVGSPTYTLTNNSTQAALQLDGVTVTAGIRVLVKNQTTQSQNGIYTVTTVGSGSTNWVLTRTTDFNEITPINEVNGAAIYVTAGNTQANTGWVQIDQVTTFDSSSIAFAQFAGAGSGVSSIATGSGISTTSATGAVTLTNTGVTSLIAGSSTVVSSATGAVTLNVAVGGGSAAYNSTFQAGYIQYAGATDGYTLAGNTAFAFGLSLPNAISGASNPNGGTYGQIPGVLLGNYVKGAAVIIPDAVPEGSGFNSTAGVSLVVEAGDTNSTGTAVGGNLYLYAGTSATATGGTAYLHGGGSSSTTNTSGKGGDAVILGGSGYNAGGAYFEGGQATGTNGNGGNVQLAPSNSNGTGTPGSIVMVSATGTLLYQWYKNGELYIGGSNPGTAGQVLTSGGPGASMTWSNASTGTVTSVSVTTANGISGTVATATTTPAITLTLGAITPTSIAATGSISTNSTTIDTTTTTGITGSGATTIDTVAVATFRTVKYMVQVTQTATGSAYHAVEILIIQDGSTVYKTEYAEVYSGSSLGTFDATISSGNMTLTFTPAVSANTYTTKVNKIQMTV